MARPNPQAAYYASLGRSTERQANRQRTRATTKRNVVTGARPRQAPPTEALQGRAFGARPARALPQPARLAAPAPIRQTPAQAAASRRFQYVSQGKAVEKAAKGQRRQTYTERPLGARRQIVAQAHETAPARRTAEQRAALQVHRERHGGYVHERKVGSAVKAFEALDPAATAVRHGDIAQLTEAARAPGAKALGAKPVKPETIKAPKPKQPKVQALGFADPTAIANIPKNISAIGKASAQGWKSVGAPKLVQRAVQDTADIAANAVPSTYHLATTAVTRPKAAARMLVDPYVEAVKHPVKSFTEHPVQTALLFGGLKAGAGRSAGAALRRAPSKTLREVGSTVRATKTLPGARVTTGPRTYSKDVIKKYQQKALEGHQARRQVKRGGPPPSQMTVTPGRAGRRTDVQQRIDEEAAAAKSQQHKAAWEAEKQSRQALGFKRTQRPSHAVTLAAQGIASHHAADLRAYRDHLVEVGKSLKGDDRDRNAKTVANIDKALESHDPDKVLAAAQRYSEHRAGQEAQVLEHGLLKPAKAEQARMAPAAAWRFGHTREGQRRAIETAEGVHQFHKGEVRRARSVEAGAQKLVAHAVANARVSVARPKTTTALKALEGERNQALRDVEGAKRTQQALRETDIRGQGAASRRQAQKQGVANLATEKVLGRERVRAGVQTERAKGRAAVGQQRNIGTIRAARDVARVRLRDELRKPVVKRKGVAALQAKLDEANATLTEARTTRPAPKEVYPVAPARAARIPAERPGRRVNQPSPITFHRERVKALDAQIATERRRIAGVAPKEHEALLSTLASRDIAREQRTGAIAKRNQADVARKVQKRSPFVDAAGNPLSTGEVRSALAEQGLPEPAFVTHSTGRGHEPALPTKRASIVLKKQRHGEAVIRGTIDTSPEALVHQSVKTARLVESAKAREHLIESFGYRKGDPTKTNVEAFPNKDRAENVARSVQDQTGIEWAPIGRQDGTFALVPRVAHDRMAEHERASQVSPPGSKLGTAWRRNVLAFSPKWLTGNVVEAAVRAVATGSGPVSYATARKTLAAMSPEDRAAAEARILSGGQYRVSERLINERRQAEDLSGLARAFHEARDKSKTVDGVSKAYDAYTRLVFHHINGRAENFAQTAMLGRALRNSNLMDQKVLRIGPRAVRDAAHGLKNTDAQVAFGREVDKMYGKYSKFSPGKRSAIATYTPFAAWTMNAANFLFHVLPRDHPVLTSVLASSHQASEEWRKQHGLVANFFGNQKGALPDYLQGSIPGKKPNTFLRASRYTPFSLATDPISGTAGLLLPQFDEITKNMSGQDWRGQPLKGKFGGEPSNARKAIAAATTFFEGQIPFAAQGVSLSGARPPNVSDTAKIPKGLGARATKQFYPGAFTAGPSDGAGSSGAGATAGGTSVRVKPVRVKPVRVKPVRVTPVTVGP